MTAEFATVLPAVMLVIVLALAAVQATSLQVRVVDAASIAARSLGRAETAAEADALVGQLIGDHDLSSASDGVLVCVTVSAPLAAGLLAVSGLRVSARSCALAGGG